MRSSVKILLVILAFTLTAGTDFIAAADTKTEPSNKVWIGTWATAAQPNIPKSLQAYRNQTLRLILRISAGGSRLRIKISNTYGRQPVIIGAAHIARHTSGSEIDAASDRTVKFHGNSSVNIPVGAIAVSDPVDLEVPALSDFAVSLFLPQITEATTIYALAQQTSYVSAETGDATAAAKFRGAKEIQSWPFLTGVDVEAPSGSFSIVAFGSSLTDGDGTIADTNGRWPDVLAQRLQNDSARKVQIGVLNEGIIGNRLLHDSPKTETSPFGGALGESGLARFDRDVLSQSSVKYVVLGLGINDILFPAFPFTPASETVNAEEIIAGYRKLIARAHKKGIRIIGTTNPAFEHSDFEGFVDSFFTPEREAERQKVNAWILASGEFDGVVDLDKTLRDPARPTQLLPAFDSGDHLHPNNAGCAAEANAFPLTLFTQR